MLLNNIADSISVVLSAPVAINELTCFITWRNLNVGGDNPTPDDKFTATTNGVTGVELLSFVASSVERTVTSLSVVNTDTTDAIVTIKYNGTVRWVQSLIVGQALQYTIDSGFIETSSTSSVTPSALTKVDDTNVTLTLGGNPSIALLQTVSLTLGWTGTLADGRIASASTWNAKENALTFSTGLTRAVNTITIDSSVVTLTGVQALSNKTGNISQWTNDSNYTTLAAVAGVGYLTSVSLTANVTGTLPVGNGGTGIASYAIGDLLYASTTSALSKLADVATGSVLVSGGVGVAPSWSATPTVTSITSPSFSSAATQTLNSTFFRLQISAANKLTVDANQFIFSPGLTTSGVTTPFVFTLPFSTAQTAGTEVLSFNIDGATNSIQHASNTTITTQRDYLFQARTHRFASATGTITNAATVTITNAPQAGTNCIVTNPMALWVQAGMIHGEGGIKIGSGTTPALILGVYTTTATLNFGSIAQSSSADLTITLTGAADGDSVFVTAGNAAVSDTNILYTAWISASDTITVRCTNNNTISAVDPASGSFRVTLFKY